jgi:uncharacterized protein YuzE
MSAAKHQYLIDNGLLDPVTGARPPKVVTVEEAVENARADAAVKEEPVDLSWLADSAAVLDLSGVVDEKGEPVFVDLDADGKIEASEVLDAIGAADVVVAEQVDPSNPEATP